jgi:hypothetical protein
MRLVIIESPYKGDVPRNERYLRACIRDCLKRGESPYASHRMLTDALDDNVPEERKLGIEAGLAWRRAHWRNEEGLVRHVIPVFYIDLGFGDGMKLAFTLYEKEGIRFEQRRLPKDDPFFNEDAKNGGT